MRAILAALLLCVAGCAQGHPHSVRLDHEKGTCTLVDSRGRVRGVLTGVRVWRDRSGNTFTAVVIFPLAFTKDDWRAIR